MGYSSTSIISRLVSWSTIKEFIVKQVNNQDIITCFTYSETTLYMSVLFWSIPKTAGFSQQTRGRLRKKCSRKPAHLCAGHKRHFILLFHYNVNQILWMTILRDIENCCQKTADKTQYLWDHIFSQTTGFSRWYIKKIW